MANTQVQLRRGDTTDNDNFTGAEGELVYDTEKKQLRIHDGATMGGYTVDPLVELQTPTEENGYTWYRLYASGWVEQGGSYDAVTPAKDWNTVTIILPVEMLDENYTLITQAGRNDSSATSINNQSFIINRTSTLFKTEVYGDGNSQYMWWTVKGMAKVGE